MTRHPSTLLAFDYGDKNIGVAIGQTVTGSANPLGSIRVHRSKPDWDAIAELIRAWKPDALIVGLPLQMDGTEQEMTHAARRFGNRLHGRFRLPVHLVDERLSTREARARLTAAGRAHEEDDPVAAQVILEDWLAGKGP